MDSTPTIPSTKSTPRRLALALSLTAAALVAACSSSGPGGEGGAGGEGGSASEIGCPDDLSFFEEHVYTPILAQKCAVCHSATGLAKGSHMVLAPGDSPQAIGANFDIVREVARMEVDGTSVLLLRPTGMHPEGHTGGHLIDVGSPEYAALSAFVGRVVQGKCDDPTLTASCDGPARGARALRRLSRAEYDATITDLFGFPSAWGASFGADTVVNGFDNNASALVVSPLLAEQLRTAAEEIAALAFESPSSVVPCDPATGEAECAADLIDTFGKRAFRRPLTPEDHARYKALFDAVSAEDGFYPAAQVVVTAMLQSPHFLYRSELGGAPKGGVVALTPHEIASELSYLFWGTMPDPELMAAADSGALAQPSEVAAQAERLLADPRSDAALDRFVDQWLLIGNVLNVPKDNSVYPEFSPAIRAAMRDETRALFRAVVRGDDPSLKALLSSEETRVSPDLAQFYGMSGAPQADGSVLVKLAGTERAGILTQGSVLATHAHPTGSSPIHRGKLVRTRVLCQDLPPPPAGFNVQPPPLDPGLTTRERFLQHASEEPCTSCHTLIDPIGFGFERFDGAGRFRDTENGKPIDTSGEIVSTPATNGTFDGTLGLVDKLAESSDTGDCFSLQWLRFAYGLDEGPETRCLVQEVAEGFAEDGQRIDSLLFRLVATRHFIERAADPGVEDGAGQGGSGQGGSGQGGSGQGGSGQGGSDPGTGQGGSGSSSGGGNTSDLAVSVVEDSHWGTGYCSSVKVENTGSAAVTWSVSLDLDGTLTDVWNAESAPDGAKTKFVGLAYNATLDPGQTASFGFCATLQ
ncbi:MAG: DUF1592 domain-containing protein [Polyangiaceae bacterium]